MASDSSDNVTRVRDEKKEIFRTGAGFSNTLQQRLVESKNMEWNLYACRPDYTFFYKSMKNKYTI
jgi:hypothetical protein